jgi:hypothetical protein
LAHIVRTLEVTALNCQHFRQSKGEEKKVREGQLSQSEVIAAYIGRTFVLACPGTHSLGYYLFSNVMKQSSSSLFHLAVRQVVGNATSGGGSTGSKPTCGGGGLDPDVGFNLGLHIAALFVILTTSAFGNLPGLPN